MHLLHLPGSLLPDPCLGLLGAFCWLLFFLLGGDTVVTLAVAFVLDGINLLRAVFLAWEAINSSNSCRVGSRTSCSFSLSLESVTLMSVAIRQSCQQLLYKQSKNLKGTSVLVGSSNGSEECVNFIQHQ